MGNLIAADEPIAFLISMFCQLRLGTVKEPPPIETRADMVPIVEAATNNPRASS